MADIIEPIRISRLKKMALSPAHFKAWTEDAGGDTASLARGRALHAHLLLGRPIAVPPMRRDKRTKAYQEWLADRDQNELILTEEESRSVMGMAESLLKHPRASELLAGERIEQTLLWERMGLPCRGTPDVHHVADGIIVDLKTTRCASPLIWQRDAEHYGYDLQMSWYQDGAWRNQFDVKQLWAIAVEPEAPYGVTCHMLDPYLIEEADRRIQLWLERVKQCVEADHWPCYSDDVCKWEKRREWRASGPVEDESVDLDEEALA